MVLRALDQRPVLVGECPHPLRPGHPPLSGRSAMVLCKLAGLEPIDGGTTWGRWYWALLSAFQLENLLDECPGHWSARSARAAGRDLEGRLAGGVVVLLGKRVQAAFGAGHLPRYEWATRMGPGHGAGTALVAVPHPSGLNHVLNDPAERDRTGDALRRAILLAQEPVDEQVLGRG